MVSSSSFEQQVQRSDFGWRLHNAMMQHGPLCIGIDPHRKMLLDWGYHIDAEGAELFSMRMLQAIHGRAAAVKFQTPMFERYGAQGFEALQRVLYAAHQMNMITIVDCMHGGLPTTISALADAYFKTDSPMLADAITLVPYYGARSLGGLINEALDYGRGVFIASLTSNREGASLQTAIRQSGEYAGKTVAYGIANAAQKFNRDIQGMGSVGLIIGATIGQWFQESGVVPSQFTGPILSPGYGWQGAEADDLKTIFKGNHGNVLVTVSRYIAAHGPHISDLAAATDEVLTEIRAALAQTHETDGEQSDAIDTRRITLAQTASEENAQNGNSQDSSHSEGARGDEPHSENAHSEHAHSEHANDDDSGANAADNNNLSGEGSGDTTASVAASDAAHAQVAAASAALAADGVNE